VGPEIKTFTLPLTPSVIMRNEAVANSVYDQARWDGIPDAVVQNLIKIEVFMPETAEPLYAVLAGPGNWWAQSAGVPWIDGRATILARNFPANRPFEVHNLFLIQWGTAWESLGVTEIIIHYYE